VTPEAATAEGGTELTTTPEGPKEGVAGTAPSAGEVSEVNISASTAAETAPGALPIRPSTRRTSEGLPSALAGYQSWYRLDPAVSPPSRGPHLKISQTYILVPDIHTVGVGDRVEPPFPEGTMLVLESKSPGTEYIEAISMMERTDESWKFQDFARPRAESAFQPGESEAGTCAGCHAQAPAESVFAQLELR
jgi:hypothetical protein